MKKLLAILLACAMFLPVLASCGSLQAGELDVAQEEANYENAGYVPTTGNTVLRNTLGAESTYSKYSGSLALEDFAWYLDIENATYTDDIQPVVENEETVSYTTTRTYTLGRKKAAAQEDNLDVYEISTANEFVSFFNIRKPDSTLLKTTATETYESLPNAVTIQYKIADTSVNYFTGVKVKLKKDIVVNALKSGVTSPTAQSSFATSYTLTSQGSSSIFKGVFDGEGHVISGIYSECGTGGENGIWGCVNGDSAKLTNFSMINVVRVLSTDSGKKNVGVLFSKLLGSSTVEISNVYVDAYLREPGTPKKVTAVGGFVGYVETGSSVSFNNCVFAGTVNTPLSYSVASFVGKADPDTTVSFENCANLGDVSAATEAAGFVGTSSATTLTIQNSTNRGNITTSASKVGGFVGYLPLGSLNVFQCENYGDISGTKHVGGIVGTTATSPAEVGISINKTKNFGTIRNDLDCTGGFIGLFRGTTLSITNSEVNGNVFVDTSGASSTHAGGFVGYIQGTSTALVESVQIENCKFAGNMIADRSSGGIVGYVQHCTSTTISGCTVAADMTFQKVNTGNPYNGGIAGMFCENGEVLVENCTVSGAITLADYNKKQNYAGGLVGCLRNNENSAYYTNGTTYTFRNCTVNVKFKRALNNDNELSGQAKNDIVNPIYGVHTATKCTVDWEGIKLVPGTGYDAQTEVVEEETVVKTGSNTDVIGAQLELLAARQTTLKAIGSQYKQNDDGSYSFRYVFGVKNIYALDTAIGFNIAIDRDDGTGMSTKEMTIYCPEVYTFITDSEGNDYTASDEGVDYLFTLVLDNVPAREIALVDNGNSKQAYIKNAKIRLTGFVGANGLVSLNQKIDYCMDQNTVLLDESDMSATLPEVFANAYKDAEDQVTAGAIPVINFNEGLDSTTTSKVAGCYTVYRISDRQVYIEKTCTTDGHACVYTDSTGDYSLDTNSVVAYRTSTNENGRYHFYADPSVQASKVLDPSFETRYEYYNSFKVTVATAGVYDFCFRVRMQDSKTTRDLQIQINNQAYCDQTNLRFTTTGDPFDSGKVASDTGSEATHRDSYLTGFSANLKAGENIITFRAPDSGSQVHVRDFYLIKSTVDADPPAENMHTFVPADYHNDLPETFGTTTKEFQMQNGNYVLDTSGYRTVTITDNLKPGVIKIDCGSMEENTVFRRSVYYYTWEDTGAVSAHGARYLASSDNRGIRHYYFDPGNANKSIGTDGPQLALKDCFMRWEFTIEEAGTYDVCFNIRASATDKRYALIQIDDSPLSESYILTWELDKGADNKYVYTEEMRDTFDKNDENNKGTNGSYLTGFSLTFEEPGTHTITFRVPYRPDGTHFGGTGSWHFRNIYMVKAD